MGKTKLAKIGASTVVRRGADVLVSYDKIQLMKNYMDSGQGKHTSIAHNLQYRLLLTETLIRVHARLSESAISKNKDFSNHNFRFITKVDLVTNLMISEILTNYKNYFTADGLGKILNTKVKTVESFDLHKYLLESAPPPLVYDYEKRLFNFAKVKTAKTFMNRILFNFATDFLTVVNIEFIIQLVDLLKPRNKDLQYLSTPEWLYGAGIFTMLFELGATKEPFAALVIDTLLWIADDVNTPSYIAAHGELDSVIIGFTLSTLTQKNTEFDIETAFEKYVRYGSCYFDELLNKLKATGVSSKDITVYDRGSFTLDVDCKELLNFDFDVLKSTPCEDSAQFKFVDETFKEVSEQRHTYFAATVTTWLVSVYAKESYILLVKKQKELASAELAASSKLKKEITSLNKSVSRLNHEMTKLKKESDATLAKVSDSLRIAEAALAPSKVKIGSLESKIAKRDSYIKTQEEYIAELEQKLKALGFVEIVADVETEQEFTQSSIMLEKKLEYLVSKYEDMKFLVFGTRGETKTFFESTFNSTRCIEPDSLNFSFKDAVYDFIIVCSSCVSHAQVEKALSGVTKSKVFRTDANNPLRILEEFDTMLGKRGK